MKFQLSSLVAIVLIAFSSCAKQEIMITKTTNASLNDSKVIPNVPQCNAGYHWSYYLNKCVPDCSIGQHNDSITGACVTDGWIYINPANSNNPYDNAGKLHNILLDYFINNTAIPISNGKMIIYSFDNYFHLYGYDSLASKSVLGDTQVEFARQFENATDKYAFLVAGHYMSQNGANYYKKLDSLINLSSNTVSFYNSVKTIETQVNSSNSLSTKEKQTLLEATSVERYTTSYWSNPSNQSKWNSGTVSATLVYARIFS